MTSLIFLLLAVAMAIALRGDKVRGVVVSMVAALLAVIWFNHHVIDR